MIGLIGGIGSGKSQVARILRDRGVMVIDADAIGHLVLGDPVVQDDVVSRFGEGILQHDPGGQGREWRVDRRALGRLVFSDPSALRDLERILHPRMRREFEKMIAHERREKDASAVVLDAAILLEAGWDQLCNLIVFVDAPRHIRLGRVVSSRGWSEADFEAREAAQWPVDLKRGRAQAVLVNDSGLDTLETAVDHLLSRLSGTGFVSRMEARAVSGRTGELTTRSDDLARPLDAVGSP